ncbi:MAG: hypothetical protein WC919_06125 [Candidatus Paceibacterota bacterium]|jgi:hypothetical protein
MHCYWTSICEELTDLRRRIWNKRLLLWWYRLFIRRNEFHRSLNSDFNAMLVMDSSELKKYFKDLRRRRRIAHKRDLRRSKTL